MMHVLRFFAVVALAIMTTRVALGSNSVKMESRTVLPEDSVVVGVYIENSEKFSAFVLPMEIRKTSGQAFISDFFSVAAKPTGRLLKWDGGVAGAGYVVKQYFASKTVPVWSGPAYCPPDSTASVWQSAAASVDFQTPDAAMYVSFGRDTAFIWPGSDGTLGSGNPSLTLSFGASSDTGTFEIDTSCIRPSNHLAMIGETWIPVSNLTFQKSLITITESSDTLSGHIAANLSLRGNVYLTGDLTIDSGVTVSVRRGTIFTAVALSDDQSGGVDAGRVEILVMGTLQVESAAGSRPRYGSTSGLIGSWYGIRVMPGGRFETGIGAVIEDAVVGVTVDSLASADTLSGLTVTDCSSMGFHLRSNSVGLINDTVQRVWPGKGIYADSANPVIEHCLIDSCEYGLYTFMSSARITDTRIDGPGVYGIYVKPGLPDTSAATPDTLRLLRDTVHGYYSMAQMYVGAISQCRVDSCGFISDPAGQRSPYGIKANFGGAVRMRRSTIRDFTTTGFDSFRSGSHLGRAKAENGGFPDGGYNSIYADSAGCGGCALRRAAHVGVGNDSLRADDNWWGASPPSAAWFSGKVDYTPYSNVPLGKMVAPEFEDSPASVVPREHSLAQNYPNPFNSATEIEFALVATEKVKINVYNILGQVVQTLADRDYTEGTHRVVWDGTNKNGDAVASGIYLYRITAGDFTQSKKMVLLK